MREVSEPIPAMVTNDYEWDAMVDAARCGTIFHTSAWLHILEDAYGVRAVRLGLRVDDQLVAGLPFLTRRLGPFRIAGSPLWGTAMSQMGPVALEDRFVEPLFRHFDHFQRRERIAFSQLLCSTVDGDLLTRYNYEVGTYRTLVLNLCGRSKEDSWWGLKSECRTAIRKAERSGVGIEVATDLSFLADHVRLTDASFARHRGHSPFPVNFYESLWPRLAPTRRVRVLQARYQGQVIASVLFLIAGGQIYALAGGADPDHYHLRMNNLLHWTIIQWAVDQRLERYDLMGAPTADIASFKQSFGARPIDLFRGRRINFASAGIARRVALRSLPAVRLLARRGSNHGP